MLSKLNFYKAQIIDFCNNRSLFILKDFDKIPFILQKEKFSKKTIEIFNNKAEEFITQNNIIADVFIDNEDNLRNFYPIITIVFIFQYEFLIYDQIHILILQLIYQQLMVDVDILMVKSIF